MRAFLNFNGLAVSGSVARHLSPGGGAAVTRLHDDRMALFLSSGHSLIITSDSTSHLQIREQYILVLGGGI